MPNDYTNIFKDLAEKLAQQNLISENEKTKLINIILNDKG